MTSAITPARKILVADSAIHGRGVFAAAPISAGEVIESCPVLRIPQEQLENLDATLLFEYYFSWDGDGGVAFGYGSLYNHSATPNARYTKRIDAGVVEIAALDDIAEGEEITFAYDGGLTA